LFAARICETKRFAEGLAMLRKATALRPSFADAWYNIGHACESQGRLDDAREAYLRAAAADPTYADPLFNLGMIDLGQDRYSSAVTRFEAYLQLDREGEWASRARKALALARLSIVKSATTR
jgi:Flp pilus assembly protein TadD